MSLLNVPAGKDLPEDIYVVIEIPANADPIKYGSALAGISITT